MKAIPCTIQTLPTPGEECWIISVPGDAVSLAAKELSGLLAGQRKRVVFRHRDADFVITPDAATFSGQRISISKHWPECLEHLFSARETDHIDYEFSHKSGIITITVRIAP